MSKRIAFIEYLDEVNILESYLNHDTVVISLNPSVSNELKKRGITFLTTFIFFGKEGHQFVLKNSFKIVEDLRPLLDKLKNENIQHAYEKTWIFHFRFHLHYYLSMLFLIHKVVKKYNPDLIISASSISNENLISNIVEGYGLANNIKTRVVDTISKRKIKKTRSNLIKKISKYIIFELQLSFVKYFFKNTKTIFAAEDTYNMPLLLHKVSQNSNYPLPVYLKIQRKLLKDRVSEMLRGKSFSFISFPSESIFRSKNNFLDQLSITNNKIRNHLLKNSKLTSFYGFNIDGFLIKYIEKTLNSKMIELNNEIVALRRVLDYLKPDKVFSQHSLGVSYALGEFCLEIGTPALLISHGSHTPHNDKFAKLEWLIHSHTLLNSHYPFVAIQTPLAKCFLNMSNNIISKMIETGPLLLANENKYSDKDNSRDKIFKNNSDKFIVLHAGTPKSWKSLRPWVFETIDEYINNINDTISAVERIPGMFLAIRFRQQAGFNLDDFRCLLIDSESYGIFTEGDIKDYLIASDLLISYSSTTIEEALQTQLPVIQYDPSAKYEHISGQILSDSDKNNFSEIYSVLSKNDLLPALNWIKLNQNNNSSYAWSRYIIEPDNAMQWLSLMESSEC